MKQYILASILLCLLCIDVTGQHSNAGDAKNSNTTQNSVKRIDAFVKAIVADTSIVYTTKTTKSKKAHENYSIRAGYKNSRLAVLQTISGSFIFTGFNQSFYFYNGEPVLYVEQLSNCSRMGSCGQVSVSFYHYLKDSVAFAGMAKSMGTHYTCYGYQLQRPSKIRLVEQLAFIQSANSTNSKTHKPAKVTLPFMAYLGIDAADLPMQESYGF